MPGAQDLLREYVSLSRKRGGEGVSPLEYQRWLDLGRQLDRLFPQRPVRRDPGRTRMCVEFKSEAELRTVVMMEIRPVGLYVHTPFAPDLGTRLELVVRVLETGERASGCVEVVSMNVGPGFSTNALGMAVRFRESSCSLQALLERLTSKRSRVAT